MSNKLRKSQLVSFDHAAAGHEGVLSDPSGELIIKPSKQQEVDFYQQCVTDHPEFLEFIPKFFGTLQLDQEATQNTAVEAAAAKAAGETPADDVPEGFKKPARVNTGKLHPPDPSSGPAVPVVEAWKPSGGGHIAAENGVVLENVAHHFDKPNVLDVKLGAQLWDDAAPEAKRKRLDAVAERTTSGPLNFRIAGMKTWLGPEPDPVYNNPEDKGYRRFDKLYGQGFKPDNVIKGFEEFFFVERAGITKELGRRILKRFIADVKDVLQYLEKQESRMYSASLLFVYEGDGKKLAENFALEKTLLHPEKATEEAMAAAAKAAGDKEPKLPHIQSMRMIDFAHATWVPGQGPDENTLKGIRNVLKILGELVEE